MAPDTVGTRGVDEAQSVMASIEEAPEARLILADVTRDDAYATMPLGEAATLSAWR